MSSISDAGELSYVGSGAVSVEGGVEGVVLAGFCGSGVGCNAILGSVAALASM